MISALPVSGAWAPKMIDDQVVHDTVAKIGSEDLAQLGLAGNEADRTTGPVAPAVELVHQFEQRLLLARLEPERIDGVALVAPAPHIAPVQFGVTHRHGQSFSGANRHGIQAIVLIGVVLVAVVRVEVPRVVGIWRIRRTRPVRVRLQLAQPLHGALPPTGWESALGPYPALYRHTRFRVGWAHNDQSARSARGLRWRRADSGPRTCAPAPSPATLFNQPSFCLQTFVTCVTACW